MKPYFILLLCLVSGCASVQPDWQPAPGQPVVPIHIYRTTIHTIMALPRADGKGDEEWAFGQRLWLYDSRTSGTQRIVAGMRAGYIYTSAFFRTLLWPSPGVVELVRPKVPLPKREPALVRKQWTFYVSPRQAEAMRAWLKASIPPKADPIFADAESEYFKSCRRYWLFYNCHHYTALALRAGGIPAGVRRGWYPWAFWGQIGKFEKLQKLD